MELLCPECLGPLSTTDGRTARCTLHGGSYRILFWRAAGSAPPKPMPGSMPVVNRMADDASPYASPAADVRSCPRHPSVYAPHTCGGCLSPICETCSFLQTDGRRLCPECASPSPLKLPGDLLGLKGATCSRHPDVAAVVRCQACSKPVCSTCDFALPGQIHVCPDCMSRTDHRLSSKRKTMLAWSFGLAAWATCGLALLLTGALADFLDLPGAAQALSAAIGFVVFIPSMIGTALSVSTLDRRLSNPAAIWVAVVWNCLLLAAFLLLSVIGTVWG